jgi:MoaA/NifB/PqqE/SkfB family radical SAM enzyme
MGTTEQLLQPAPPAYLQIEVTGSCNLRCRMCIVRYRPALPRSASMSFEQFKRLVDAIPTLQSVTLQGIGEPLLAPDIYKMVAYASERGINAGFNTNATLLTRRAAERLLDGGIAWLCFSLDGASKATYEFVRDQASWTVVERNIDRFVGLMRERGMARPSLSLVMVLMRRNFRELPALVERAARWGIPKVFTQGLSHDFSDAEPEAYAAIAGYVAEQALAGLPAGEAEAVFERARAIAQQEGIDLRLPSLHERPPRCTVAGTPVGCDWPWQGSYVTYDGRVKPCCMLMGS